MGNVCFLNSAVTVYRACSSSVVFSHCSEEWWALSEAPPRAAELGFWFGVSGVSFCYYPVPSRERQTYLGIVWQQRFLFGRSSGAKNRVAVKLRHLRALRGRSGCTGGGRSREGALRKRQGVPAAKQNNTESWNLSAYIWTLLSPNIYIPWL